MPDEDNKISNYSTREQSLKVPFIISADLEYLLQKINTCQNNPEKYHTEKKAEHALSGYSTLTFSSFDESKMNKNIIEEKIV